MGSGFAFGNLNAENLFVCNDYEEGWTASVLTFFICGDAGVVIHKTNDYLNEISGQNSLEFGSAMETEEWPANQRIFRVQICMEPSFLKSYGSNQLDSLPLQLKNLIEGNKQEDFILPGTTTPAMQLAIGQILTCPYRMEKARQLLCEGKLSVATVANIVGYANTGHFAVAFKRKFSISPSACRLGEKPTI
ncbi:AraC family transcriptional regulator [uncultured Nostoc sp.]|uniref:helix-turn-helix transcriptional regulator n=1 Tax=uncultured Nostoc sp. TaxID=340711 RepID=UPI00261C346C|nr:AraC family transcriptional regulator [uncultured Nostoc sp.]